MCRASAKFWCSLWRLTEMTIGQGNWHRPTGAELTGRWRPCHARVSAEAIQKHAFIHLRGGNYFLNQPVIVNSDDSDLTLVAYKGEKPILSGGRRIDGWREMTLNGKQVWTAEIPEVREGKWSFHQ